MNVKKLIDEERVLKVVDELASRINSDYKGKEPLLIGCLTGSFVFMADLVRRLKIPVECDFMKVSSYGDRMSAGELKLLLDVTLPVKDRHVLVVEDIVDTGQSLSYIMERLRSMKPKSLESSVLLYKESERSTLSKSSIKYLGLTVPDLFIVGYGIDCAQKFRELPYIASVETT
jgi:hypoxanthine phosphoribosyltransferase